MLPSAGVEASLGSLSSRDVLKTGWLGAAPLLIPFPPTRGTFVGKLVGGKYWGGKPLWSSRQLHISLHLLQRSHEGPIVNGLAICTGLGGEWFLNVGFEWSSGNSTLNVVTTEIQPFMLRSKWTRVSSTECRIHMVFRETTLK